MRLHRFNVEQQILFPTTSDLPVTEAKPNDHGVFSRKAQGVKEIHYKARNLEWFIYILRLSETEFIYSTDYRSRNGGSSSPLSYGFSVNNEKHLPIQQPRFKLALKEMKFYRRYRQQLYLYTEQDAFDRAIYRIKSCIKQGLKPLGTKAEQTAARVGLKWLNKQLNEGSLS